MAEYYSGAYFIQKKHGSRGSRGRRGIGLFIVILTLLTAGICLLVIFFPTFTSQETAPASAASSGKSVSFYMLCTFESDDRQAAYDNALLAAARGGAGYIYNDGSYKVVAAVYRREDDAKALAEVNDGAFCLKIEIAVSSKNKADKKAFSYLAGEWFDAMSEASTGLERGSLTDAQADLAAHNACLKLLRLSDGVKDGALCRALTSAGEYSVPASRDLKSYLRYVAVRAVVLAAFI